MKHQFHNSILREYDIRGIVGSTLRIKDAYFIGKKFAVDIKKKYKRAKIVVGYDGRLSSPLLKKELCKGLLDGGASISVIGVCPSPMLYYACKKLNCDGAIMITGSHNPLNYNGFKILSKEYSYYGKKIISLAQTKVPSKKNITGVKKEYDISYSYILELTKNLDKIDNNLNIVWDPGNGATCDILKKLIKILPGKHTIINSYMDGTFPSHDPDPTVEKNLADLKKMIIKNRADIGIAFDGDGDRIGIVDSKGNFIPGDQLLLIFSNDVLKENRNCSIISDVKASDILFKEIKKIGGIPIMWKTGHSLIKEKMKETGAVLAGEMSGHIFFSDRYFGFDDALYAALRLLEIISKNKNISEYITAFDKVYSTPEIKVECADNFKFSVIEKSIKIVKKKHKNVSLIDGIRVNTSNGWWLLRASNTQPALIIRCEAASKQKVKKLLNEITYILKESNIDLDYNI